MAEIELSHLNRQCLDRRICESVIMAAEVKAWNTARNEKKVLANWRFTTEDVRIQAMHVISHC